MEKLIPIPRSQVISVKHMNEPNVKYENLKFLIKNKHNSYDGMGDIYLDYMYMRFYTGSVTGNLYVRFFFPDVKDGKCPIGKWCGYNGEGKSPEGCPNTLKFLKYGHPNPQLITEVTNQHLRDLKAELLKDSNNLFLSRKLDTSNYWGDYYLEKNTCWGLHRWSDDKHRWIQC